MTQFTIALKLIISLLVGQTNPFLVIHFISLSCTVSPTTCPSTNCHILFLVCAAMIKMQGCMSKSSEIMHSMNRWLLLLILSPSSHHLSSSFLTSISIITPLLSYRFNLFSIFLFYLFNLFLCRLYISPYPSLLYILLHLIRKSYPTISITSYQNQKHR